jgi:hypothetical protein
MAKIDEMNAMHAKEHAGCTRAETVALLQKNATAAAAVLRGLSDAPLAKSGIVHTDAPPMSVEQAGRHRWPDAAPRRPFRQHPEDSRPLRSSRGCFLLGPRGAGVR